MANDLDFKVAVDAKEATKAVEGFGDAVKKAGDTAGKASGGLANAGEASGKLVDAIDKLGGRNNAAKDALEGISAAAKGGEGSLFGLAKAFKGFKELFTTGLAGGGAIGLIVTGLTLAISLAIKFRDTLGEPKKTAEELAKEIDIAKTSAENLGKSNLDALQAGLKGAADAAAFARKEFDRALEAKDKLDSREKAAQLAELRANPKLTDAEKTVGALNIERKFADATDQRELQKVQRDVEDKRRVAEAAQQLGQQPNDEVKRALAERSAIQDKQLRARDLEDQLAAPPESFGPVDSGGFSLSKIQSDNARRALEIELNKLKQETAPNVVAGSDARVAQALKNVDVSRAAVDAANKALEEAKKIVSEVSDTQAKLKSLTARQETAELSTKVALKDVPTVQKSLSQKEAEDARKKSVAEGIEAGRKTPGSGGTLEKDGQGFVGGKEAELDISPIGDAIAKAGEDIKAVPKIPEVDMDPLVQAVVSAQKENFNVVAGIQAQVAAGAAAVKAIEAQLRQMSQQIANQKDS